MLPWIAPAIALAAAGWPALLIAAPLLPLSVAGALYAIGSLICHQIPERSFYLQGFQLPVCARCLGVYAGAALGSLAAVFVGRAFASRQAPHPAFARLWRATARSRRSLGVGGKGAATAIAAVPTVITIAIEWGAGWPVSNVVRAAAAVPLACAVAFVVVRAVATVHYDECAPRRPIGHGQPPAHT